MNHATSRRVFLLSSVAVAGVAAVAGGSAIIRMAGAAEGVTNLGKPGKVTVIAFDDTGKSLGPKEMMKVVKTEEDWKAQLSGLAFNVTRQEGTERAFTGPYWDAHDAGMFRCVCCDNALFTSETKYDSGTGWPSFWQPLAKENVNEIEDRSYGMVRIAVECALCDAHLGHVFNDGPAPTGLRYCMNGVSLRFIPKPAA